MALVCVKPKKKNVHCVQNELFLSSYYLCVYSKAVLLSLVLRGPSSSAHFGCLLNLTNLIQFISSLVEAPRPEMCA